MATSEFTIIAQYFTQNKLKNVQNSLGVGDDCALLSVPDGYEVAITTDTMVEGVHFFSDTDPFNLGHKLIAVNLSDLAAMGAQPCSVTLALTLPEANESWIKTFAAGLFSLADQFAVDLIGGDTTKGPLTLTLQAMGLVPKKQAMLRSGAKEGDLVFVTGSLGDAGLGLKVETGYLCTNPESPLKQFHQPMPRVTEGLTIRPYASACIDLSDGLASDLKHILNESGVGATLDWHKIPLSTQVVDYIQATDDWMLPLTAGEDYELCFTVSPENADFIDINCTQIGVIENQLGLRILRNGDTQQIQAKGFEHFSE